MRPTAIERANLTIGPPADWDEATMGHCATIHVLVVVEDGVQFLRTAWQLSPEDLARANAGASLILGVAGHAHPVVNLMFGEPPADRPLGVVSPSFVLIEDERPDGSLWLRCVARYGDRELTGEVCLRDHCDTIALDRGAAAGLVVNGVECQARELGLLPA